jgi:2,6-dihydroxypyridine 3-monooxygenase
MSHSHALAYPIPAVAGDGDGEPLLNWLWYRNVAEGAELDDAMTARDGTRRSTSLPAGLVPDERIAALRADAAAALPPQFAELVRATAEPFIQAIFDIEVPRMAFGRVCLIGDAAFALRPHAAAGSAKAAEDAFRLGEAVRAHPGDVPGALAAWEPARLELGRSVLARTREAGNQSQFQGTWRPGAPLPFGLYRQGDSAMAAT